MAHIVGDRAVVLGGSIAGCLAARVLAPAYREVTVIDRDQLTERDDPRRAVPQGHHIHALLARGQRILEELFPGLTDELVGIGVPVGDFGTSLSWYFNGEMIRKTETGLICVAAGRPLLEARIRQRVKDLGNVTFRDRCDVMHLATTTDRRRVTGVHLRDPDGQAEVLDADLLVDATGRGSRTHRWLVELGYPQVAEEKVKMDLTYTTCHYRPPLPFDPIGEQIAIIPVATPQMPRGAIFARLPDRYSISLTGLLGDRPPTDRDGLLAYVRSLPVPEIYRALRDAEPMSEPKSFHFPASVRRRYERMDSFPEGLLMLGDAVCTFNPVYGQGMTAAALQAQILGRHLQQGAPAADGYFRDVARAIDAPWDMSAGPDLGFAGVQGRRTLKVRIGNSYVPRLQAAAVHDPALSGAFLRAAGLVDPLSALMRPNIVRRVLRRRPAVGE
ncbi:FAD-dependent oxidoreductase [Solwaraspora sp. WMMA2101]|uniref:FAD-dependent oxidoreductase n=1 Tax=Solwaraspora sp. WMMA2101 TaxID=3404124 RepID=UPI003B923459